MRSVQVLGCPITPMTVLKGTTLFSGASRVLVEAMRIARRATAHRRDRP